MLKDSTYFCLLQLPVRAFAENTRTGIPRQPEASRRRPEVPELQHSGMDAFSAFQTPFDFSREQIEEIERRRPGATTPSPTHGLRFEPAIPSQPVALPVRDRASIPKIPTSALPRRPIGATPTNNKDPKSLPVIPQSADPRRPISIPSQVRKQPVTEAPIRSLPPTTTPIADPRRPAFGALLMQHFDALPGNPKPVPVPVPVTVPEEQPRRQVSLIHLQSSQYIL